VDAWNPPAFKVVKDSMILVDRYCRILRCHLLQFKTGSPYNAGREFPTTMVC